jgi:hypothetical protein
MWLAIVVGLRAQRRDLKNREFESERPKADSNISARGDRKSGKTPASASRPIACRLY